MKTFYDVRGKILGQAYSLMACHGVRDKENHHPHSHNPEYAMYGPYFCEGYPKTKIFDTKPREPLN